MISGIVEESPDLELAGLATNGVEALAQIARLKPDVVTLDVEMPELDGLETLRRIMRECPTPVVMLSSLTTRGASESIKALALGAIDVMAKPFGHHSLGIQAQAEELVGKILAAAAVDVASLSPIAAPAPPPRTLPPTVQEHDFPVVIIASSTGGPRALRLLIPQLSPSLGAGYIIVQHLPDGFSGPMAEDLDNITDLHVREAAEGDVVRPGEVFVARSGSHCVVGRGGKLTLSSAPPMWGVRPAADVTMTSAAPVFGRRLIGVVLTGMGQDGADGLRVIREAGGQTLAEDQSSCVIYGMPRVAIERGFVGTVAPIERMGSAIGAVIRRRPKAISERNNVRLAPDQKHRANKAA